MSKKKRKKEKREKLMARCDHCFNEDAIPFFGATVCRECVAGIPSRDDDHPLLFCEDVDEDDDDGHLLREDESAND